MTVRELQDILSRVPPTSEVEVLIPAGMGYVELRRAWVRRMRLIVSGSYRVLWRRAKPAERKDVRTFLVLEG